MVVGGRELIDTLWNVNADREQGQDITYNRINRYIMECKYCTEIYSTGQHRELIDTLWNVNDRGIHQDSGAAGGINRYIMECKLIPTCEQIVHQTLN